MASRQFNQFLSSFQVNPVLIEGSFQIGSNGAVVTGSYVGSGITASSTITVQNLGTGLYRLQLADPYSRLLGACFEVVPGPTSTVVSDNSGNIVVGQPYMILGGTSGVAALTPSTATNWYALGLHPGLNPTVGMVFVATSGGSTLPGSSTMTPGQGLVQQVGVSNIDAIEILPGSNLTLAPTSASSGISGAIVQFQTLRSSSTTNYQFRFNPSSCTIRYNLFLRNSSVRGYNESTTAN